MSDTAPASIRALLQNVINAPTWEETHQFVMEKQALLLTDEADAEFAKWSDGGSNLQTLSWYRELLQRCRADGIDATFNALPEPRPLNKALRAFLNADGPEALARVVQHFPEITSDTAIKALQDLIAQVSNMDQERATSLTESFTMIQMARLAKRPIPEDLLNLLADWVNTETWNESRAFLQANAEHLLTNEAIEALTTLSLQALSNDQEEAAIFLQHCVILEKAREESIDAAYAELLNPPNEREKELLEAIQAMISANSPAELIELVAQRPILLTPQATEAIEKLLNALREDGQEDEVHHIEQRFDTLKQLIEARHDPLYILLGALLQVQTPAQLQQAIDQHPALLDAETLNKLNEMVSATEQAGNRVAARILRLRLNEIRRLQEPAEKRPDQSDLRSSPPVYDGQGQVNVTDSQQNIVILENQAPVTQNNFGLNNYSLPPQKWQQSTWRGFDEGKDFVGRQHELDTLLSYLTEGENIILTGRAISATLQGMAGIGKTYLAYKLFIEIPQRFSSHFPGGVIWIDVGPQITDEQRAQFPLGKLASHAFGGLLPPLAVGQLDPDIVASWLREAAPGRFLVIFDDIWDETALRFLSRALPPMAVRLVTTRSASTASALGGQIVSLEVLSLEDGLALLKDRLRCQNNTSFQAELEEMVKLLGGHALALDIAAALIEQPVQVRQIQRLLEELRQKIGQGELSSLSMPERDRNGNLEKSLEISYRRMNHEQQKRFRTLGIFAPETPITVEAAAAIWGIDESTAGENLVYFKNLALLTRPGESAEDTYRQHSLLRAYALALLIKNNELTSASWAHANYYANLVWQAENAVPKDFPLLDQHLQNILSALKWSADNEPALFSHLLDGASQFLFLRGQFALLETYLPQAANAAAALGAKRRQANLLKSLGDLESHLGHLDEARSHYDAALPLHQAVQDQLGQANLLRSLGDLEYRLGHLDQARSHYDAALPLFQAVQNQLGQANLLQSLGDLERHLGHLDQARSHYDAALSLYQAVQDQLGQANLLRSLGDLEYRLGHLDEARSHYDAALPLFQAEHNQLGQANLLRSLGDLEYRLGHLDQARSHYDAALSLYQAVQDQLGQANLLQSLGDLERHLGHLDQARSHYDAALPLFQAVQNQLGQANLLRSLGHLERQLGDFEKARMHYDAALTLYLAIHDHLGEAYTLKGIADIFLAQKEWEQARTYYEQALPLFTAEQDPLGQANTLIDLGRVRFELGDHEQGIRDVRQAATLYHFLQDEERARRAERYVAQMRTRLFQSKTDSSQTSSEENNLLTTFLDIESVQEMIELARQHPELLSDEWFDIVEAFIASQEIEEDKLAIGQRLDTLKRIRQATEQGLSLTSKKESELVSAEEPEILQAFVNAKSPQDILQLVQQHPQLLSDKWFDMIEALIAAQQDEGAKKYLSERFDTLKQIRQDIEQERVRAIVTDIAQVVDKFARADWGKRRELLDEQGELLLSEAVEPVFDMLAEVNKENSSVTSFLESLRVLLRRCRTWGIDATFYFATQMRLGDGVNIPAEYEDAVMRVAGMLARQREDSEALVEAVEVMEVLARSLPDDLEGLFRGALLRNLADAMLALPEKHPLRRLEAAEVYYREALAAYQAADRPISLAFIRRSLGNVLSEQDRYEEALEPLQAAVQGFKEDDARKNDTAWALSAYANALDRLGRQEEALGAYGEAIALLPDSAPLLRNRAETLISLRRLEQAEADLARAVELDGNEHSPYLWFRRAQLAIARGDAGLAEQMIEEVLKRDSSFDVLLVQAQSAWLPGDLDTARVKLQQALGQANQGERVAMRRDMERLLEEHPELPGGDEMRAILNAGEE